MYSSAKFAATKGVVSILTLIVTAVFFFVLSGCTDSSAPSQASPPPEKGSQAFEDVIKEVNQQSGAAVEGADANQPLAPAASPDVELAPRGGKGGLGAQPPTNP